MELSLDFLVDYFSDKKTKIVYKEQKNDNFNLKPYENYNSKNFNFFNNIFEHFVDRVGVKKYFKNRKHNISLLFSILYALDDNFTILENSEQEYLINQVKRRIVDDIVSRKLKLKRKIPKNMVLSRMKTFDNVQEVDIYIYCLFFDINIVVFDFNTNEMKIYYFEEKLNYYKKNIFISKKGDLYQLLTYSNDNLRYFRYNSSILEKIIFCNKLKNFGLSEKEFIICNNWDELLEDYKKLDLDKIIIDKEIDLEDSDEDSEVSLNSDFDISNELIEKIKDYSTSKFLKEKKDTLLEYLSEFEEIEKLKNKKKKDIVERIKCHLNKYV